LSNNLWKGKNKKRKRKKKGEALASFMDIKPYHVGSFIQYVQKRAFFQPTLALALERERERERGHNHLHKLQKPKL